LKPVAGAPFLFLSFVYLSCLLGLARPAWADPATLWGQGAPAVAADYQAICARARLFLHHDGGENTGLPEVVAALREATRLRPDGAEGWALLGEALVNSGMDSDPDGPGPQNGRAALLRAQKLGADDPHLFAALALSQAQAGELLSALFLYRRLTRVTRPPLLLRRTGDVLMAMGRLSESIPLYREACTGTPANTPSAQTLLRSRPVAFADRLEIGRACYALAVALDRAERGVAMRSALREAMNLDPTQRSLHRAPVKGLPRGAPGGPLGTLATDFVPAADREYYLSLVAARVGSPCEELAALRAYLLLPSASPPASPPSSPPASPSPVATATASIIPPVYAGRARARLEQLLPLSSQCKAEYSHSPDVPLGSQRDRDGGETWQMRTDAGSKSPI
jgi:tetratricopeptide (TPR) repeat protein